MDLIIREAMKITPGLNKKNTKGGKYKLINLEENLYCTRPMGQ
jgi:hypothetical protein